jgi:hypothetical protein
MSDRQLQKAVIDEIGATDGTPSPNWDQGVPYCSEEKCSSYDGKRCFLTGDRPGHICEPAVSAMARLFKIACKQLNREQQASTGSSIFAPCINRRWKKPVDGEAMNGTACSKKGLHAECVFDTAVRLCSDDNCPNEHVEQGEDFCKKHRAGARPTCNCVHADDQDEPHQPSCPARQ